MVIGLYDGEYRIQDDISHSRPRLTSIAVARDILQSGVNRASFDEDFLQSCGREAVSSGSGHTRHGWL